MFYDSRNNVFTPREGSFLELTGGFSDESFEGDANFRRATTEYAIAIPNQELEYFPVIETVLKQEARAAKETRKMNSSVGEFP